MKLLTPIFLLLSMSMISQNLLIKNTSFDNDIDLYGWDYGTYGRVKIEKTKASYKIVEDSSDDDNHAVEVSIERSYRRGDPKQVYLIQDRLKLKKKKKYRVTFYVKSTVLEDEVYVSIGSGSAANGRLLKDKKLKFKGDGKWKRLTMTFVAKNTDKKRPTDFKNAAVYFGFNYRKGKYLIDNVKVEEFK